MNYKLRLHMLDILDIFVISTWENDRLTILSKILLTPIDFLLFIFSTILIIPYYFIQLIKPLFIKK